MDLDRYLHWVRHALRTHKACGVLTSVEQKEVIGHYEHGLSLQFSVQWVLVYRHTRRQLSARHRPYLPEE